MQLSFAKKGNIKSLSYDLFKTGFKYSNTRILRDQAIEIHNYDKQYYPFYRLKSFNTAGLYRQIKI